MHTFADNLKAVSTNGSSHRRRMSIHDPLLPVSSEIYERVHISTYYLGGDDTPTTFAEPQDGLRCRPPLRYPMVNRFRYTLNVKLSAKVRPARR